MCHDDRRHLRRRCRGVSARTGQRVLGASSIVAGLGLAGLLGVGVAPATADDGSATPGTDGTSVFPLVGQTVVFPSDGTVNFPFGGAGENNFLGGGSGGDGGFGAGMGVGGGGTVPQLSFPSGTGTDTFLWSTLGNSSYLSGVDDATVFPLAGSTIVFPSGNTFNAPLGGVGENNFLGGGSGGDGGFGAGVGVSGGDTVSGSLSTTGVGSYPGAFLWDALGNNSYLAGAGHAIVFPLAGNTIVFPSGNTFNAPLGGVGENNFLGGGNGGDGGFGTGIGTGATLPDPLSAPGVETTTDLGSTALGPADAVGGHTFVFVLPFANDTVVLPSHNVVNLPLGGVGENNFGGPGEDGSGAGGGPGGEGIADLGGHIGVPGFLSGGGDSAQPADFLGSLGLADIGGSLFGNGTITIPFFGDNIVIVLPFLSDTIFGPSGNFIGLPLLGADENNFLGFVLDGFLSHSVVDDLFSGGGGTAAGLETAAAVGNTVPAGATVFVFPFAGNTLVLPSFNTINFPLGGVGENNFFGGGDGGDAGIGTSIGGGTGIGGDGGAGGNGLGFFSSAPPGQDSSDAGTDPGEGPASGGLGVGGDGGDGGNGPGFFSVNPPGDDETTGTGSGLTPVTGNGIGVGLGGDGGGGGNGISFFPITSGSAGPGGGPDDIWSYLDGDTGDTGGSGHDGIGIGLGIGGPGGEGGSGAEILPITLDDITGGDPAGAAGDLGGGFSELSDDLTAVLAQVAGLL